MKKRIVLIVAAFVVATLVLALPAMAATRVGFTSGTLLGVEVEPPEEPNHLAYGVGLVEKGGKAGAAASVTKYFGDFEWQTNRPYASARLGLLGSGGGLTYAAAAGYSVSMGPVQLLTNVNYTDGKYGIGLGATLQF